MRAVDRPPRREVSAKKKPLRTPPARQALPPFETIEKRAPYNILNKIVEHRAKIEKTKWKEIFWDLDVFKEPVHDPDSHSRVNVFCTMLFYLLTLAYTIYASILFMDRPAVTNFSLAEMSVVPVQHLRVEVQCSTPWGCTKTPRVESGKWVADGWPWLKSTFEPSLAMTSAKGKFQKRNFTRVPLKFSSDQSETIEIRVPGYFTNINSNCSAYGASCAPVLRVMITADSPADNGPLSIAMDIEPHQKKAVYIGCVVRKNDVNESVTYELFNQDLFYEGKNAEKTATLKIRMSQFAQVFTTLRPGSLPELFGEIGGFSATAMSVCGILGAIMNAFL